MRFLRPISLLFLAPVMVVAQTNDSGTVANNDSSSMASELNYTSLRYVLP